MESISVSVDSDQLKSHEHLRLIQELLSKNLKKIHQIDLHAGRTLTL